MRTRLLLTGMILSFALIISGCGKKKENTGSTAETGVPPSIASAEAKGPVLVTLTPEEINELKIPLQTISSQARNFEVHAPGTVFPAPNFIGIVSAPVEGRIVAMSVQEGQPVGKGQVIVEIESLVYGTLVADYLQAAAEVDLQSNQLQRMEKLTEKKISAEMDLEKTRADHTRAVATLNACYAKLKTLGVSDNEIDALKNSPKINPRLKIHSPISGVVDSHKVELGQAVLMNDQLATVISLDKVLVKSYLAPEDGTLVNTGDSVVISHRLITEEPLTSKVTTINPGLDENNRSIVANILVSQKKPFLKPGDNVETIISTKSPVEVITVSMDAVTYDNNDPVVFVSVGADTFEMRKIRIREIANGFAVVSSGLKAGDKVAVGQVFSLKALSRFKLISEE
jgi:cobalt-zinc-cadmium efflux system membrane fusion protein